MVFICGATAFVCLYLFEEIRVSVLTEAFSCSMAGKLQSLGMDVPVFILLIHLTQTQIKGKEKNNLPVCIKCLIWSCSGRLFVNKNLF